MSTKYILIVHGEPFSTFSEIIGKYFTKIKKYKKKIIIIGNFSLIQKQLNLLNFISQNPGYRQFAAGISVPNLKEKKDEKAT